MLIAEHLAATVADFGGEDARPRVARVLEGDFLEHRLDVLAAAGNPLILVVSELADLSDAAHLQGGGVVVPCFLHISRHHAGKRWAIPVVFEAVADLTFASHCTLESENDFP